MGSPTVDFRPGPITLPQTLTADPGTAGSTTLLLQVALPCLLFSPPEHRPPVEPEGAPDVPSSPAPVSELVLRGGTNAALAPQIDYVHTVFFPFLATHFGIKPTLTVERRGYYPKGGGSVRCTVPALAGPLPAVVLTTRGAVRAVGGSARVGGLPLWIAQRMMSGACRALVQAGIPPAKISITSARERDEDVVGAGGGIVLWAETEHGCVIGGSAVSTREKKPEAVGGEAAEVLVRNLNHEGCVDEYLQDQMIIFLALAKGTSVVRTGSLTDHTRYFGSLRHVSALTEMYDRTAIHVAQRMTEAQFHVDESASNSTVITCKGIGFAPAGLNIESSSTLMP